MGRTATGQQRPCIGATRLPAPKYTVYCVDSCPARAHRYGVVALSLSECFPSNLRRQRRLAKLTQEKLAHRAGLHRNVVGLLERGEQSPTLRTIDRLAEALGIPPRDLLSEIAD